MVEIQAWFYLSKPDGIPEFWANIFRNVDLLSDITEEYDYPVLNHLLDVKVDCRVEPMVRIIIIKFFTSRQYP